MDTHMPPTEPLEVPAAPAVEPVVTMPDTAPTISPAPAAMQTTPMPVAAVTSEIPGGWNWGAFLLNWIWALGNNVWIGLLALLPGVGFVMAFVLGAKGNEMAWKAKQWESVDEFRRVQKKWSKAAVIIFFVSLILSVVGGFLLFFLVGAVTVQSRTAANLFLTDVKEKKASDAYALTTDEFKTNTSASKFDTFVNQESPMLKGDLKINSAVVSSDNGTSTAKIEATSGDTLIVMSLENVNKHWLVQGVNIK